jgi:hypothetical protein
MGMISMIFQQLKGRLIQVALGKSMTSSILAAEGEIFFSKYRKYRSRIKTLNKEFKNSDSYMENLCEICLRHLSPVTSPIALISQIQRSGGSLLSQLFDGHPELHAHPHELKIGYPKKYIWPRIDLSEKPERWFEVLFEDSVIRDFKEGYKKGQRQVQTYPFILLPALQRRIFLHYISSLQSVTLRDVFDGYMTSYFYAWLNNQNCSGEKKFISAFTPRLSMFEENMELFLAIYPDGRLISVIRDPKNWFPSAHRHETKRKKYDEIRSALRQWVESSQAMLRNKERFGHFVCIIRFEDLVSKMELVMSYLAEFLDIKYDNILLVPTFNKNPVSGNTSFDVEEPGIIKRTLSRYKTLSTDDINVIDEMTTDIYQKVLDKAVKF